MLISFLFLNENICCGYSLEAPRRGATNEYPQHMFSSRNKKHIMWILPLICSYDMIVQIFRLFIIETPSILGKNFSRWLFWNIFFFIFYFSQKTDFELSCKLSPMEEVCMKCQILFSGKKKTYINLSSAELVQRVIKVKITCVFKSFCVISVRLLDFSLTYTCILWHRIAGLKYQLVLRWTTLILLR